jgi:hypothetical protein
MTILTLYLSSRRTPKVNKNRRVPISQTHKDMLAQWKTDPAFMAEYDALEEKYKLAGSIQIKGNIVESTNEKCEAAED